MEAERSKAVVREYFQRLLNGRDLTVCDELLAHEYRDHDTPPETPIGPDSTKVFVAKFLDDYPDLTVRIEDILAENDRVAVRAVWSGTHRMTGDPMRQMGLVIVRLNEVGQLAERWSAYASLAP